MKTRVFIVEKKQLSEISDSCLCNFNVLQNVFAGIFCSGYASFPRTARASWSAHDVDLAPQVLPRSFAAISSAFIPSQSFAMALRFPLHPPVKRMLRIMSPSRVN